MSVLTWKKRKEILQELVESEQAYLNKLNVVCTLFLIPLSTASQETTMISMSEVRGLFSCVVAIKNVASHLFAQLSKETERNPNISSVGQIFLGLVCNLWVMLTTSERAPNALSEIL